MNQSRLFIYMRNINRQWFLENNLDGVIVSSRENKFYFADLNSGRGYVLLSGEEREVLVDGRYYAEMKQKHPEESLVLCENKTAMVKEINAFIERNHISRIGMEGDKVTYSAYVFLAENIHCETVTVSLDELRTVKDEEELDAMRTACRIACDSFREILPEIHAGMKEKDIENLLCYTMKKNGAEKESFDIIVASGTNGAFPHAKATNRVVQDGELVTIDFGCKYHNYCSDITRTIAIGKCSDELKKIYSVVLEAHDAALKVIRPGVRCEDVDRVARDVIEKAGYGKYFSHNLGHAIGINDHEDPFFGPGCTEVLQAGMILSDEPGIYIEGLGGVRIEDDVLVTENGCEVLTDLEREWVEL